MRYVTFIVLSLLGIIIVPTGAIDDHMRAEYPTLVTLSETDLPIADRADIARRFYGVTDIPAPPIDPPPLTIGTVQSFVINSSLSGGIDRIRAELQAVGAHVYVWVEVGNDRTAQAQALARHFDQDTYPRTQALWGRENIPGIDGDVRVHLLFTTQLSGNIGAYFAAQNTLAREIFPYSNEREMMVFNLAVLDERGIDSDLSLSYAAHEYQHMIRAHLDPNELAWMDEGFSMLTEYLLGYSDTTWAARAYMNSPHNALTHWGIGRNRAAQYGAPLLFMLYFYERYGADGLHSLSTNPANGLQAVDAVVRERENISADEFYADWVLANILRDHPDYGYQSLSSVVAAADSYRVVRYPYMQSHELPQYSTRYFEIDTPPDQISLALDVPAETRLFPAEASSGAMVWYSNRGDDSNPRLTRTFDLRDVPSAVLQYRTWFDIEPGWDYGYVSVSTDGGARWQIQATMLTSAHNPHGKAYGMGYSGLSQGWRTDRVDLTPFAGQVIDVRFEIISDDSLNHAGMALDDLRVDAIGYHSDLERDGGGWQAEGWLHTDNRLPQYVWVQAAQLAADDTLTVTRWQARGASAFIIETAPDTERIYVSVSPIAPMTSVAMPYWLEFRHD